MLAQHMQFYFHFNTKSIDQFLPSKSDVVNEEDGVEEDPEQIVEAGDEPANYPLRRRVG